LKPVFEHIERQESNSFKTGEFSLPAFDAPWHHHPECELTYIVQSSGKRFVGDHVASFEASDLVLLGPMLPHYWKNNDQKEEAKSIVIQFLPDFLGNEILSKPELSAVSKLIKMSSTGIQFKGLLAAEIGNKMQLLTQLKPLKALSAFLEIMDELANWNESEIQVLSSQSFNEKIDPLGNSRMNKIKSYISMNFKNEISLEDIANHFCMTREAFCRYFRNISGKTFIQYLNEFRIGYAKKLLLDSDLNIAQVCFESGFGNISNFNRQFFIYVQVSPSRYRAALKTISF
jgi:AraC-like DNA-binding protein